MKLVRLDPATGHPADPADGNAIEAAFIVDHGGWYWLIASFDACCRGVDSTYRLVVGRSRRVEGPYVDRAGRAMLAGGGTSLLAASAGDRFRGPGHAGFLHDCDGSDHLICHAYDAAARGAPTLRLARVTWDAAGWPVVAPCRRPA